jgi:tetratricopeptide (TPR) repeat protein
MPPQAPFDRRDLKGPIWTVPIPPNPLFTGRAQTLTDIDVSFSSTRKAALVGLGGVGKTQAAARYAYLRRDNYDAVLWVAAASRETLVSDFVALGARLGMPQMGAEETIAAVKRWLETREKWLLVLDNADDLSVLGEFVPAASPGHVLVTTQAQATGTVATTIEISEMKPEEGGYFILRRGKLISEETAPQEVPIALREVAETVSGELGGLPLALDQAGAFIEESACGLSTYLELYRERRARLLRRRGNLATAHPDSVVATFTLSFEKIVQANPAAADVLRLCAFLSPDAISEEIFTTACTGLGADLEGMAGDAFQFNEAVAQILKYSLVRRDSTRKTITIHRLVQAVLQDGMTAEERRQWADRAVRAVNCNFPKSEFGSRAVCERLIRHAEVCGKLIREYALDFQEGARLLNQAGAYLLERARFKEAEDLLERAAKLAGSTSELRPTFLPVVLNNLAAVYHAIGKYDMAERANKQVLGARERHLGPDHPEVAQSLNNLGTVYMVEGKYKEAKAVLKRALAIKEKSLNPKDPELATTLNNLGGLHEALAEYSEAESAYRRALEIRREVLARISHQLLGTGFNGAGRGDCGLTLSRQRRKSACG